MGVSFMIKNSIAFFISDTLASSPSMSRATTRSSPSLAMAEDVALSSTTTVTDSADSDTSLLLYAGLFNLTNPIPTLLSASEV